MAEHMNIKWFGLVVTKILPRGNLKITSKMLKPWSAILREVSRLRKIYLKRPKTTEFLYTALRSAKIDITRCSPTQRSQNQLRFKKSRLVRKRRKASNTILIGDLRTTVRDFSYWSCYGPYSAVLRSTKSLTTPVPIVRDRIPTLKLKIPGKAFLKSETRTSVTFKL